MVRENWPAIELVAEALRACGKLVGDEIDELLMEFA